MSKMFHLRKRKNVGENLRCRESQLEIAEVACVLMVVSFIFLKCASEIRSTPICFDIIARDRLSVSPAF